MCDYSLHSVKSREAKKDDKLITANFGNGTRGFGDADPSCTEPVAVCLRPGTEIAFDEPVRAYIQLVPGEQDTVLPSVAKFAQINKDQERVHHDCLEFSDGTRVLLTHLHESQRATVLQLPPVPRNDQEVADQRRVEYAG